MTIVIKNFQIFETSKQEVVLSPLNLKNAIQLVQNYNAQNEPKIRVFSKPVKPRYEFSQTSGKFSISIGDMVLPAPAQQVLQNSGYVIFEQKFLMISPDTQKELDHVFSEDIEQINLAISRMDNSQVTENLKNEIKNRLNNQRAELYSDPNVETTIDLYPYQKAGVDWLLYMHDNEKGALLADDMGLGKTAQVIALIANGFRIGKLRQILIVVPNSLLANWEREIEKFTNGISTYVHWGMGRVGFIQELKNERVIITTYSTVVNDLSLFQEFEFDLLVCDEASLLKNHNSARVKAINSLRFEFSVLITGTPFENSMSDLWSITNVINKDFLGTESDFNRKYVSTPINELTPHEIAEVESKVSKIMIRRLKEDVLDDLPEKIDIHTALTPSTEESGKYNEIISEIRNASRDTALALISHLRKFTSHPALYEDVILETSFAELVKKSAKFSHLASILEEVLRAKEKALVFANHVHLLSAMQTQCEKYYGVPCFKIDGSIEINERQNVIDTFQAVETGAILFLNPITAGMGLNITAANHVIHYSRQWNPALEAQATARAFRNGQTKSVNAYYLYYADTIEEIIHKRLNLKSDISSSLVRATEQSFDDEWYLKELGED